MIRKLARAEAQVEVVQGVFRDSDSWPQWMPGVAATRTLSADGDHRLVEVILLVFGRRLVQKLECREQDGRMTHRQVKGWFRKWEAVWTFAPPPDGQGTTISLSLDFDLGVAGLFVPRKLLGDWVGGLIQDTLDQGRRRAEKLARSRRELTGAVPVGLPLLQVWETADGFEVRFAGRTFHVEALEPAGGSKDGGR
ncbi:MAG: hypothetical protein GY719_28535 [bacterium]|nr:hypothetical protein [bacterium]